MSFPSKLKVKKMRTLLEKAEPSRTLPKQASTAERVKYMICEKFVVYILDRGVSQAELARKLNMDPARLNEIVKYRIDLFTIDKLVEFADRLDPNFKINVA
jgi:predicted XRE-type DNA-binding protein